MADRPAVKTRRVTRDKLASFLKNQELIKVFEDLTLDVSHVIPDAVMALSADASFALQSELFGRRVHPQLDVRGDGSIGVVRDAQGFQLSLVPESLVQELIPFLPRPPGALDVRAADASAVVTRDAQGFLVSADTASTILATQIFGA